MTSTNSWEAEIERQRIADEQRAWKLAGVSSPAIPLSEKNKKRKA